MSSSFSKGYEVIIHTKEKELQKTHVDSLNRNNVKYGQLRLNNMENPPLDIWFETHLNQLVWDLIYYLNVIRVIKTKI